jgi:hypothetical protein
MERNRRRRCATFLLALVATLGGAGASAPAHAQAAAHTTPPAAVPDSVANRPGGWQRGGKLSLALAQSSFSSNWKGGDAGAFAWTLHLDASAERQVSPRFRWSNALAAAFGETAKQRTDPATARRAWESPSKSTDRVRFESLGRWTLGGWANPYAAFAGESQFLDQSSPLGTLHLNPVKLTQSAGLAHAFAESERKEVITRMGAGIRETLAKSFVDPVTRATASFVSTDGGVEWETTARLPLATNRATYRARLLVFAPLFYSKSKALETYDANALALDPAHRRVAKFWRVPDVDLVNTFSTQVTKAISVDLFTELVYDKFDTAANVDNALDLTTVLTPEIERNTRLAAQFKETLAIGIGVALF